MTFWLGLLFVLALFSSKAGSVTDVLGLICITLLIVASVINDGFNKLEKAIKENKK